MDDDTRYFDLAKRLAFARATGRTPATARADQMRALTPGPWHEDWPYACHWCGQDYRGLSDHYPYCSAWCAIHAETEAAAQGRSALYDRR